LLIILAVVIIWLGPIVESYVERNDKELIGRRVEMDNLSIRLFDGTASADNIILYEADSETTFASIERMEAEMAMGEIFDGHIHLTRVHLTRPYLSVVQNGDVFNFDEMIEFIFVKYILPDMLNESVEEESEDEWKITIENVTIEDGYINYYDEEIDQRWELTAMNIHTDELILEDAIAARFSLFARAASLASSSLSSSSAGLQSSERMNRMIMRITMRARMMMPSTWCIANIR
jgi:uncharacterized protein involved in outer membrane biogenesis